MKKEAEIRGQRSWGRGQPSAPVRHSCFGDGGFTLIELMIVIVVITVLAGITLPVSKYATRRAREASQKVMLEKIRSALEDYRAAYGEYPITPTNQYGDPNNPGDVLRHYPAVFYTTNFYSTNTPYLSAPLALDTVEYMRSSDDTVLASVDYCLTYPLVIRQLEAHARPFVDFPILVPLYIMADEATARTWSWSRLRRAAGGGLVRKSGHGLYAVPVDRHEAVDPVSKKQWKYSSDGVTYILTNNVF